MHDSLSDSKKINKLSNSEKEEGRRTHAGPFICTVARTYPQKETIHTYDKHEEVESGYLY